MADATVVACQPGPCIVRQYRMVGAVRCVGIQVPLVRHAGVSFRRRRAIRDHVCPAMLAKRHDHGGISVERQPHHHQQADKSPQSLAHAPIIGR